MLLVGNRYVTLMAVTGDAKLVPTQLVKSLPLIWGWGTRVTHICVSNLAIIGSDNGLLPGRCQAIIWTNAGILLIGPLGTNFSETLIGIETFFFQENAFENVVWKIAAILSRPQCVKGVAVIWQGRVPG